MPQATGVVEQVSSKELPSGLYWSFKLDNEWFRTGRDKPPIDAGYKVRFNYEVHAQYGNQVKVKDIEFKKGEAPPPDTKRKVSGAGGKDDFWAKKEERDIGTQQKISFQAATNTAINIVNGALDRGFLVIPKSKKAEVQLAAYNAMIKEQTVELFRTYQNVSEDYEGYMQVADVEVENAIPEIIEEAIEAVGDDSTW